MYDSFKTRMWRTAGTCRALGAADARTATFNIIKGEVTNYDILSVKLADNVRVYRYFPADGSSLTEEVLYCVYPSFYITQDTTCIGIAI